MPSESIEQLEAKYRELEAAHASPEDWDRLVIAALGVVVAAQGALIRLYDDGTRYDKPPSAHALAEAREGIAKAKALRHRVEANLLAARATQAPRK